MASLRKASAYSKKKVRPYTRVSSKRTKAYIKTKPVSKIVKFNMGNTKAFNQGKFDKSVKLITEEKVQVRDNALESGRLLIFKSLEKDIPGGYYLRVKVFPHHIMRENKTAAGAGADRLSSGMKHSFGITIGRSAIVPPKKDIFEIHCETEQSIQAIKKALIKIRPKIPAKTKIIVNK